MLDVKKQFSGVHPQIFTFLRHPTLRTWSQWHHDRRYWVKRGDAVPAPVSAHPHGAQGGNGHGDTDASASKAAAATLSHLYSDPALTANLDGQAYRYGNWQLYGLARAKLPPATTRTDTAFLAVKDGLNDLAFVGSKAQQFNVDRPPRTPRSPAAAPSRITTLHDRILTC